MAQIILKKYRRFACALLIGCLFTVALSRRDGVNDLGQPDKQSGAVPPAQIVESKSSADEDPGTDGGAFGTPSSATASSSKILAANPGFEEVRYYLLGAATDPLYGSSWHHTQTQTSRAWDLTTGSSNVKVAVIDSGFALDHEDLSGKWATDNDETGLTTAGGLCWTGTSVEKRVNDCDDDGNGYVDDWRGYDFFNGDNNVATGLSNSRGDATSHGSMVAGMVAATANNSRGSVGIDQAARIMPLQVFSDDGEAYTSDIVTAIEYAVDNDAKVINLSLGTNTYDGPLLAAIQYAKAHGVVVVVASGNCAMNDETFCNGLSGPGRMSYPALYPEALAVGATNQSQQRASFSSYGPTLDIVAPGQSVGALPYYTAGNATSGYASASGTSFSSPLVAGITSLLIAQNPGITPSQVEYVLTTSAEKPAGMSGAGFSDQFGYGIANAHRATLLGLAKTQDSLLGARELSPHEPSIGRVWRAKTGSIASDESILVGCRVSIGQVCSAVVQNGSVYSFSNRTSSKAEQLQYIFVKGSEVPTGTWSISVHNSSYGNLITTLTR